ncbi:MAG: YIP1 family protein [Ardenticatenaceae bacterium]|nr:YIP1 family protein [Anaerolineales bacterium]MCB8939654.1 YIP1 family protein [Ardenticatenaceae bacterium]MCB8974921.1 YIP1 family protein [Ardenticatenaceae bacterium]
MLDRIIGVLKLDANVYEEIEADENATTQAAIVVAVVAIVGGLIGGGISAAMGGSFLGSFLSQLLSAFIGWLIWSGVTYFVGTSLFGGKATMGEMLRVLGFAQAPGILGIIPVCGSFVGWVWTLACTFIAIRQGLDLDNSKAAMTAVIAFIAVVIMGFVIGAILAAVGLAAGAGMGALQGLGG